MLICLKRIYNFCLFHALLGDISMCFATLSYLFTHIWTNLLTQCTQCQFLPADVCKLQVFTHTYRAPKISQKSDKESAGQKLLDDRRRARGEPGPTQAATWCGPPPGHATRSPGGRVH